MASQYKQYEQNHGLLHVVLHFTFRKNMVNDMSHYFKPLKEGFS